MAQAHVLENMGLAEPLDPLPPVRNLDPIASQEIQRMAIDIESADCEMLSNLDEDVREAFFITQLFLQRPGSLSRIVGPKCQFLGPSRKIAEVSDPALVLGNTRESMYYLDDMHAIIVTHQERDAIAYGMFYHGEDPITHFLDHRQEAERDAASAKLFLETSQELEVRVGQSPASQRSIISFSSASSVVSTTSSSDTDTSQLTTPPTTGTAQSSVSPGGVTTGETRSSAAMVSSGTSATLGTSSDVPNITPIGPEPPPQQQRNSLMLWYALGAFVVLVIALIIGYKMLKKHANNVPDSNEES